MSRIADTLLRDLRTTMRMLAARPGWTAAAILCLAIATAANTAAFTLVNGLLLRPLPYDDPEQLVMVALRPPKAATTRPFALREYRALAEQSAAADGASGGSGRTASLLARTYFPLSLAADDGARMTQVELVSGNYFSTLRLTPFLGRFFDDDADRERSAPIVVLSHRLWQRRFASNPAIVGQTVRLNGRPAVVAGIAPPGFVGAMQLIAADAWLPAAMYPDLAGSADVVNTPMFGVMGRLAAGVTREEAAARLSAMATTLPMATGGASPSDGASVTNGARTGASADAGPGAVADAARSAPRQPAPAVVITRASGFGVPVAVEGVILTLSAFIYVMMALLMAVACANVAALILARGAGRSREIAVRLSLGASRLRIARQLLTESVVLALAGCAAGALLGIWLTQVLVARLTTPFQYIDYAVDVRPDVRVLAYSALATGVAAILCGIAPIRLSRRVDVIDVLKQSAARGRSRESMRALHATVVVQFAVSTTLLVAAGMLVRTYVTTQATRPNFATTNLISSTLDVGQVGLDRAAGIRLYDDVVERLSALPGVTDISLTRNIPLRPNGSTANVVSDASTDRVSATSTVVSPRFFQTLGLTLRQGRVFTAGEPARPRIAVIDDAMAHRLWPNASAVGRTFRLQPDGEPIEVIGVVSNVMAESSVRPAQPMFYQPFPQEYSASMSVLLRVQHDPARTIADVRRIVRDINPDLAIEDIRTLDEYNDTFDAIRRGPATAFTFVGLLGLLLSGVGLYGVVAYSVRERIHELGIRLALGARPADVRRLVLRQGGRIALIGLAIGTLASIVVTQILRRAIFGSAALDPTTLVAVSAVLSAAAFAALYVPARWASRVEPARTLRSE